MRKLEIEEIVRADLASFQQQPKMPLVAVLDNLRSRSNVGTLFRSADAFALQELHLCGYTPTPPHPEIRKTALDAELSVAWQHHPSALVAVRSLKQMGYLIIALEHTERSLPIRTFTPPGPAPKLAVLLGNEVVGVEQAVLDEADVALEIPQFGTKHSLNVAVAAGIAFYELRHVLSPFYPGL